MSEELAVIQPAGTGALSLKQIADRVNLVHSVLEKVMRKGTHFGTVPGCGDKMVLLKPGADVLAMTFRLVPQFKVERTDLENGHREFDVTCSMFAPNGELLGQGVGSASTMEKKYRYRRDSKGNKTENEDIADTYNTVLKIAKKRAHIDATLTVTGAADLFTQDLIDDDEPEKPMPKMPEKRTSAPSQEPATPPVAPAEGTKTASESKDAYLTATGVVEATASKTKSGKAQVAIKLDDGHWYSTFRVKDVEAPAKGDKIEIAYTVNGDFRNLVSWSLIRGDEPKGPTAEEIEAANAAASDKGSDNLPF